MTSQLIQQIESKLNPSKIIISSFKLMYKNKLNFIILITLTALIYIPIQFIQNNLKHLYEANVISLYGVNILGTFFPSVALLFFYILIYRSNYELNSNNKKEIITSDSRMKKSIKFILFLGIVSTIISTIGRIISISTSNYYLITNLYNDEIEIDMNNPQNFGEMIILSQAVGVLRSELKEKFWWLNDSNVLIFTILGVILIVTSWFLNYVFINSVLFNYKHSQGWLNSLAVGLSRFLSYGKVILITDVLINVITLVILITLDVVNSFGIFNNKSYIVFFQQSIGYVFIVFRCYCLVSIYELTEKRELIYSQLSEEN